MNNFHKILLYCLSLLFLNTSCGLFDKELKQDEQLGYYRYQVYLIPDSLETSAAKIEGYKSLIEQASIDELLITPRKKNKLLSEIYNNISGEYFEAEDIDNALACSTLAIVLDVENQDAYYNRACIYQVLGKDSLAIIDYTSAINYNDKYADAYYNRGIIYEKRTDFQLAVEDYSRAMNLNPTYLVDVYNNRGNTYQEMKLYGKAIKDYNIALDLDSLNVHLYCNRADAYMQLGDYEQAEEDYSRAAGVDSTNVTVMEKIKEVKKQQGKNQKVENNILK